jgi:hypothetical protein
MDVAPVWEILLNIPVGRLVAWVVVISAIISAIVTVTIKLYKLVSKVKDMRDADADKTAMLHRHDEMMQKIDAYLANIKSALDEQKEVNLKQVRYQIVHTCDDALNDGYITAGKLKSLEELYEEYTGIFHGNGYVKTLMGKIRELPVRGKLDE